MANLISNACKFSAAGASVRVAARGVDDHVELSVSDSGRGIPEAFRSQLFQPFAQEQTGNTRETGGTGLGLHIAQQLCERLGGTIDFESEVGVGTTFRVRLPVRDDHA
jgi:signal transduction histidine kinase